MSIQDKRLPMNEIKDYITKNTPICFKEARGAIIIICTVAKPLTCSYVVAGWSS